MPAEWEPHAGTWLTWPHNPETWPGQDMKEIEIPYVEIIKALLPGEIVNVLAASETSHINIRNSFNSSILNIGNLTVNTLKTNDSWIRDYGPNFLIQESSGQRKVAANLWKFDSWGGKYEWDLDDQAGRRIMDHLNLPYFEPGIVLEGGGIEVNGEGLCLTTEQCLLNPNRNGGLSKEVMESWLQRYLGVREIIWCLGDIEGDDTDGHIDNLVRFVAPDTVVCAWEEDPADPNHACLKENYRILESYRRPNGKPLNILKLPMPSPVEGPDGRLPASYANFYIGNKAVLVPAFNDPNDQIACDLLKKSFPERNMVRIPSRQLVGGLGGVHCLTQQQPLGD